MQSGIGPLYQVGAKIPTAEFSPIYELFTGNICAIAASEQLWRLPYVESIGTDLKDMITSGGMMASGQDMERQTARPKAGALLQESHKSLLDLMDFSF